jgi:acyl dehydratase
MRLVVRSRFLGDTPLVGIAIDNLRFLRPVRAGDRLRVRADVLEVRPSRSGPERGYLVMGITTLSATGEPVLTQDWTLLLPRRGETET